MPRLINGNSQESPRGPHDKVSWLVSRSDDRSKMIGWLWTVVKTTLLGVWRFVYPNSPCWSMTPSLLWSDCSPNEARQLPLAMLFHSVVSGPHQNRRRR